jgi:hypothetical protein
MNLSTAVYCILIAAADVWTVSPLDRVFRDTAAPSETPESYRLYAARGERESFQIAVEGDRRDSTDIVIEAEGVGKYIAAPTIQLVDYVVGGESSPRAIGSAPEWPDALLPESTFQVEAGETRAVWLTYTVGEEVPPGVYRGAVTVRMGKKRKRRISVTIEVFDFALPKVPSLRTHFYLDRHAIRDAMPAEDYTWQTWQTIYDMLAPYRISYALTDSRPGAPLIKSVEADADRLDHLDYAARSARMNTVNVGLFDGVTMSSDSPSSVGARDPLQHRLHAIHEWAESKGLISKSITGIFHIPQRPDWSRFRNGLFRIKRLDGRSTRLLAGELSPFFERYAEIWAIPLSGFHPGGHALLRDGRSLSYDLEYPPVRVSASSALGQPSESAYDGSFFSKWVSDDGARPWLQIDFANPVTTETLRIATTETGIVSRKIRVRASRDTGWMRSRSVDWKTTFPSSPFEYRSLDGVFDHPGVFDSLRIEFGSGPVTVYEVSFGQKPAYGRLSAGSGVQPWLYAQPSAFPSFHMDADPIEYRLGPWVCWGHDQDGILGGALNLWPPSWKAGRATESERPWKHTVGKRQGALSEVLLYPGGSGVFPSVRLELFRDGLEDYEYLRALSAAVAEESTGSKEYAGLLERIQYDPLAEPSSLRRHGADLMKRRIRIGRALTALAKRRK